MISENTVCTQIYSNTTGATIEAGTAYCTGAPELTPGSGLRLTRSLVLCVCFVDRCLSFCHFSFGHCVFCPSIYRFQLPFWYLQTLLRFVLAAMFYQSLGANIGNHRISQIKNFKYSLEGKAVWKFHQGMSIGFWDTFRPCNITLTFGWSQAGPLTQGTSSI